MQEISKLHYSEICSPENRKFFAILSSNYIYRGCIICRIEIVQRNNERIN